MSYRVELKLQFNHFLCCAMKTNYPKRPASEWKLEIFDRHLGLAWTLDTRVLEKCRTGWRTYFIHISRDRQDLLIRLVQHEQNVLSKEIKELKYIFLNIEYVGSFRNKSCKINKYKSSTNHDKKSGWPTKEIHL